MVRLWQTMDVFNCEHVGHVGTESNAARSLDFLRETNTLDFELKCPTFKVMSLTM